MYYGMNAPNPLHAECPECGGRGEIDVSPPFAVSPDYVECGFCEGAGGEFCDFCDEHHTPVLAKDGACDCDERGHRQCCPVFLAEAKYFARYFGQDYGTPEEKRARLMAMDPRPVGEVAHG